MQMLRSSEVWTVNTEKLGLLHISKQVAGIIINSKGTFTAIQNWEDCGSYWKVKETKDSDFKKVLKKGKTLYSRSDYLEDTEKLIIPTTDPNSCPQGYELLQDVLDRAMQG